MGHYLNRLGEFGSGILHLMRPYSDRITLGLNFAAPTEQVTGWTGWA